MNFQHETRSAWNMFWLARANLVFVIPASSLAFLTRSNAIYYKYLINLSCLVCTVSYGSSFFPSNYGLCASRLGHNTRWKILVHNLRYWPRAQLIGYIYCPVHHQQLNTEASKLGFCRAIIGLYNWVAPGKNSVIATSSEIFKYVRIHPNFASRPVCCEKINKSLVYWHLVTCEYSCVSTHHVKQKEMKKEDLVPTQVQYLRPLVIRQPWETFCIPSCSST